MASTYQLGPYDDERFVASHIDELVKSTVDLIMSKIKDDDYNSICSSVTEAVRQAVVDHGNIPRHKIAVQSFAYENVGQSALICSKSLWDSSVDNYSSYVWKHPESGLIVCVLLFCLYKE
jgi:hypothetical protein